MEELKHCPFCGGEAEPRNDRHGWWVACHKCTALFGFVGEDQWGEYGKYATEAEAVAAWNTRAEKTCYREKHGTKMDGSPRLRCSLCGYGIGDKRWNYCPNCGAKAVGE